MPNLRTPPRAIFNQIQANLRDRYRSGVPILKELMQNAEDARATTVLLVARPGWPNAGNQLLRVPGLVVANNGEFREKDRRGILSFADSAKGDETPSIGRFGFGQKAVFHLCDAFVAHAFGQEVSFSAVVNPCLDVIDGSRANEWDQINEADLELLGREVADLKSGFFLWIPFRCESILPAPKLFFTDARPTLDDFLGELDRHAADLRLVLAGLRRLDRIEVRQSGALRWALERKAGSDRMEGPGLNACREGRAFRGHIVGRSDRREKESVKYVGREAEPALSRFDELKASQAWPETPVFTEQGSELRKEKAVPHGAVLLVEGGADATAATFLDWGVFLPVDRAARIDGSAPTLRLLLHGYFFVDSGRRSIEGFGTAGATDGSIRRQWNEALRDEVVLPLLPGVLLDALGAELLSSDQLAEVVRKLRASEFGTMHAGAIAGQRGLVRRIERTAAGPLARWSLVSPEAKLRPLPAPDTRGKVAVLDLFEGALDWSKERGLTLVCDPAAALTRSTPCWSPGELGELLSSLRPEAFLSRADARALAAFLCLAVGDDPARREAVGPPLLRALRTGLRGDKPLAPDEDLREIVSVLRGNVAVRLPKSAGERRDILRALASVENAPACLRNAWLRDDQALQSLARPEATLLLRALQPLLDTEDAADAAGAVALAILRLLGTELKAAASDPTLSRLTVLRATIGRGPSRPVSLQELLEASRDCRLLKDNPQVQKILRAMAEAVPDARAVVLRGDTAELFGEFGEPFVFAQPNGETFARIVARTDRFGAPGARAGLLDLIFNDAPGTRSALRILAAGDRRAESGHVELLALKGVRSRLDSLAGDLLAYSKTQLLVPGEIVRSLNGKQRDHLGIRELDAHDLGELLIRHADDLTDDQLDDGTITELLESEVPDEDLRKLPIFPARNGNRYRGAEIWREAPDWPVPPAMTGLVPMLVAPVPNKPRQRAERLVEAWSPEAQIRLALDQPEPHRFAGEILDALARVEGEPPPRLCESKWLIDRRNRAWAPDDVLDLPEDVLAAAQKVLGTGTGLPFLPLSDLEPRIRERTGFAQLRGLALLPDEEGAMARLLRVVEDCEPVGWMGERTEELDRALGALARLGAALPLPGWPLLAALIRRRPDRAQEVVQAFRPVTEELPDEATAWMSAVAEHAERGEDPAWKAYTAAFGTVAGWSRPSRTRVLGQARVRTESGDWRLGRAVANRGLGLAPSHLLHRALRSHLLEENDAREGHDGAPERGARSPTALDRKKSEDDAARSLGPVLDYAKPHVPLDLLVLLVGLVGQSEPFRRVAETRLRSARSDIERIWKQLRDEIGPHFQGLKPDETLDSRRSERFLTFVAVSERPKTVEVETLSGEIVALPVGDLSPLQVLGDIHIGWYNRPIEGGLLRYKTVEVAAPPDMSVDSEHVKRLCSILADTMIGPRRQQQACHEALDNLTRACDRVDQSTVESARSDLEDRLPHILDELKLDRCPALRAARDKYRQDRYAAPPMRFETIRPKLKAALWKAVCQPDHERELLDAVRRRIEELGYARTRILFELFQNADDACHQHPPPDEPHFRLEIGADLLRAVHWGRLVNHLGADPGEGERNGWQRDLFNMLLMNLSEKREDVTGRFGLGFKSVHLIADEVGIASGFVSCRIRGGMLPEVWDKGRQVSHDHALAGRRATVIDLHLDPARRDLATDAVDGFCRTVRWLPAMSRAIRRIELVGADNGRQWWTARYTPSGAEGIATLTLGGPKPGRALALDLGEETTLFLPLDPDGPARAEEGLPRLWLLAPLEETLRSGWLMNGFRFRVDPGRGRLAGAEADRNALFQRFGERLGARLVALHDWVRDDWPAVVEAAGLADREPRTGADLFLRRLADLFAADLDDPLAKHLHGRDRGLGRLIAERDALPTGLEPPFAPLVKAGDVRHELVGALAEPSLQRELAGWRALHGIRGCSVDRRAAKRLADLGFGKPAALRLADVLRMEVRAGRVDPALAARLGSLLTEDRLRGLERSDLAGVEHIAKSLTFLMIDGSWSTAALPPRDAADADEEERRILAFAPDRVVADSGYRGPAVEFYRLARRRSGFQQSAPAFAEWAIAESDPARQEAILRYVLEGRRCRELGRELGKRRPHWLPSTSDDLRSSDLVRGIDANDMPGLLALLYPEENRQRWETRALPLPIGPLHAPEAIDAASFFERLDDWWERNHQDERARHDQSAYPNGFSPHKLRGCDDRKDWFTFFALGIFRTIGRTHEGAHRIFVERAMKDGWWQQMATAELPSDPGPWVRRLEDLARAEAWRIDFPQWRRALADLYVLARWLPDYMDAFRNLPALLRQHERFALSDVWRPSASPLWQRRGIEGAPLTQSIGLGANWMIREAIRHGIWDQSDAVLVHPFGWAATARVRSLLAKIRLFLAEPASMDLSSEIFTYVRGHLDERASFLGDLDLPLQIVAHGDRRNTLDELLGRDLREADDRPEMEDEAETTA